MVLSRTEQVDVPVVNPNGRRVHRRVPQTIQSKVPMGALSASDRGWVEERNPCESSLAVRQGRGSRHASTQRPAAITSPGSWMPKRRNRVLSEEQAPLAFRVALPAGGRHAGGPGLYRHFRSLVPDFDKLPMHNKEQYGVDFRIDKPTQAKGKVVTTVSDNR